MAVVDHSMQATTAAHNSTTTNLDWPTISQQRPKPAGQQHTPGTALLNHNSTGNTPSQFLSEALHAFLSPLGLVGKTRQKWPKKYGDLFDTIDQVLSDLSAIAEQEQNAAPAL